MSYRSSLLASTVIASGLLMSQAGASDLPSTKMAPIAPTFARLPAVDGVNGKIEGFGGWADTDGVANLLRRRNFTGGGLASVSLPLGQTFGLQVDALAASHRGDGVLGGAAHLFWRDPSTGLFGAYGSITRNDRLSGLTHYRAAAEGAVYLDRFTIGGLVGYEWGNKNANVLIGAIPGFNVFDVTNKRGRFFDMVDVSYYATDNWKFSVGHRYVGGRHAAAVGTEALLANSGGLAITGYVEGRLGERDYKAVMAGVKIYFGQKEKTLIRRHREDDPPNWLKDDMFTGSNQARPNYVPTGGGGCGPCGGCGPRVD